MAGKFVTGLSAGAGSFIGLVVGAAFGQYFSKKGPSYDQQTAYTVVGSLAGMTAGAFTGAALAANSDSSAATGTAGIPAGLGAHRRVRGASANAQLMPGPCCKACGSHR